MKLFLLFAVLLTGVAGAFGQSEQSPIVEKDIEYKDWVYKSVSTGTDMNLRKFTHGKKLVLVAYFAPWCPNWKHDAAFVQAMYEKYKPNGLDVIAVGNYDPVDAMKKHIDQYKLTFPAVWESDVRTTRTTSEHYKYRKSLGDNRGWGSPWYIFLEADKLEPAGLIITKKASVVNGELIKEKAEEFIRKKLGMEIEKPSNSTAKSGKKQPIPQTVNQD